MPPAGVLLSVVVADTHTAASPDIAVGNAFTVTLVNLRHPVGKI